MKSFEQQCVLIHEFLNQGDIAALFSFIGINDAYFNAQCLSNAQRLFSEILSPKKRWSMFWQRGYQDSVLVSFIATPPAMTTATHSGEKYLLHTQVRGKVPPQNYIQNLVLLTWKFMMFEWNGGHWKLKRIFRFGHLQKSVKDFQKSLMVSSLSFKGV